MGRTSSIVKARKKIKSVENANKKVFDFSTCEKMTGEEFHKFRRKIYQFYYQNCKTKDFDGYILTWMKENHYSQYDRKNVGIAIDNKKTVPSIGIWCRLLSTGIPDILPQHAKYWSSLPGVMNEVKPLTYYVRKYIENYIEQGKQINDLTPQTLLDFSDQKSIQEHINDQVHHYCAEIDGIIDENRISHKVDLVKKFKEMNFSPVHAKRIKSEYKKDAEEVTNALNLFDSKNLNEDESQLLENYKGFGKKDLKKIVEFYQSINEALDFIIAEKKTTRKRKVKTISKEKITEKALKNFNYMKSDPKLKITSENPQDIIGSKELLTFDYKYNIIRYFVVDPDETGLMIKGSSIVGYDKSKSGCKKVKKIEEFLNQIKTSKKNECRKLFEELKTKMNSLNSGRLTDQNLLLRIF